MINLESNQALTRILRVSAVLWLAYTGAIMLFDLWMLGNGRFLAMFQFYYLPMLACAGCFLLLAWWGWAQRRTGRLFVPTLIVISLVLPMANNVVIQPSLPRAPTLMVEGIALRTAPITAIALILLVWQYRWRYVVLVLLGTAAVRGVYLLVQVGAERPAFYPAFLLTLIYPASYLTVGYVMSQMIRQLRTQQRSLHDKNLQLSHYASTLEQLSTSRERNRIARELHDVLAHTLSGLTVQLESVKAYWEIDPKASLAMVERSLDATRNGLEETRRALKALRASPLEDLGLGLALEQLVQETAVRGNLQHAITFPDQLRPLPPDIEQGVYRIAGEALANVLHHAGAKCIQVVLFQQADERLTLRVIDDGRGFDTTRRQESGHYGLTGMHERAALIGGTLKITSQPDHGTTIELSL
jgi:signal transduction histidine kinase